MNALDDVILKLNRYKKEVQQIAKEEVAKLGDLMSELQNAQLLAGVDAYGKPMPKYVANSRSKFAPNSIRLFDKGDFYGGMKSYVTTVGVEEKSTDWKNDILDSKYKTALGLNDFSLGVIHGVLPNKISDRFRKL